MRKGIACFSVIVFLFLTTHGDIYVKGNLHFFPFYDGGVMEPEEDAVYEWWFTKGKVGYLTPRWRFILDEEKNRLLVINLREKTFAEVNLPMNLLSHVDQQLADVLERYQISGIVKKPGKKRRYLQLPCEVYTVSEWIVFQKSRFYDRERTLLASESVPFDWKRLNQIYSWIRSFFKPEQSYQKELDKLTGFILASDDVRFHEGDKVKYRFEVREIDKRDAPAAMLVVPEGFKKKEKFTREELIDIRTMVYFYYR